MGMVGIGEAVAVAVEGMMALTTRRCMCRAMGVEDLMVDVIVEGMAAVASAAAAAMEEAVIVEEAAMVEVVEAAAVVVVVVVDATEELAMATISPKSHICTRLT